LLPEGKKESRVKAVAGAQQLVGIGTAFVIESTDTRISSLYG
jgi:hypothetical protein